VGSLATIGLLARAQLEARRLGFAIELRDVPADVRELIRFAGLEEVLPVESRRQPEQGEDPRGVEEEGQLGDLPA
jgi:hypothetical protein